MHWVIAETLKSDKRFPELIECLERQRTPYTVVNKAPFSEVLLTPVDISGPVFAIGMGSMQAVSKGYGWAPGYIEAYEFDELLDIFGDQMLNYGAVVGELGSIEFPQDKCFLRPVKDDKSFAGTTMMREVFAEWRANIAALEGEGTITLQTRIVVAPLRKIQVEYRMYVVGGRVVTGSVYKLGDVVQYLPHVDERVYHFTQAMVQQLGNNKSLVMDIADTEDGLKIIETNSISSSGFYAIDLGKFVNAINDLEYRL